MSDTPAQQIRGSWGRAAWGGLLSLLLPGTGQVYARSWRLGVGLLGVWLLLGVGVRLLSQLLPPDPAAVVLVLGLCGVILVLYAGSAIDAVRRIRRHPDPAKPRWFRSAWFTAIAVIAVSTTINAGHPLGWRTFAIPSGGTLPTLLVGDMILTDTAGDEALPAYGDLIVFELPRDPSLIYVKRVVGLPGDRVQMKGGRLFINGTAAPATPAGTYVISDDGSLTLAERFIETLPGGSRHPILLLSNDGPLDNTQVYRVPEDSLFVLGDNRDNSQDSRMPDAVGYVPLDNVIGRARTIYWSWDFRRILSRIE